MKYDVSVIGDCVIDYFILADSKIIKTHRKQDGFINYLSYVYGDKVNVDEFTDDLGGSACNAAMALKNNGLEISMVSVIGDDIYSKDVFNSLKKRKIKTKFLVKERGKKLGISFVLLGQDRDRTILTYRVKNDFNKINMSRVFSSSKSLYVAGINRYSRDLQTRLLVLIKKNRKPLYMNPSIFQIENTSILLRKLIKYTDLLCVNMEEAKSILKIKGDRDRKSILKELKSLGSRVVVVTDGEKGSYAFDGEIYYKSGIYKTTRVDATGAGDSFFSTFVFAYRKGYDVSDSLKYASINAASVISDYGAQRGLLSWKELEKRFKQGKVKVSKI